MLLMHVQTCLELEMSAFLAVYACTHELIALTYTFLVMCAQGNCVLVKAVENIISE